MNSELPTIESSQWSCCDFLDATTTAFANNSYKHVRMYFYGATRSGWKLIRKAAISWLNQKGGRSLEAFIGTDHALTEPEALEEMVADGVKARLLVSYSGIFHPKVIIFESRENLYVLSGSNNLTGRGLRNNIEFATALKLPLGSKKLTRWEQEVASSSKIASKSLIAAYRKQRNKRQEAFLNADIKWNFTWNERKKILRPRSLATRALLPESGAKNIIYEVMPRETGTLGSQIQILKKIATDFFQLPHKVGASINITLRNILTREERVLKMTYNPNTTMRLSIHEADFTHRPCFLIFSRRKKLVFDFVVLSESQDPIMFEKLDATLGVRSGTKRRFAYVDSLEKLVTDEA